MLMEGKFVYSVLFFFPLSANLDINRAEYFNSHKSDNLTGKWLWNRHEIQNTFIHIPFVKPAFSKLPACLLALRSGLTPKKMEMMIN